MGRDMESELGSVLIADSDARLRTGVADLFERAGYAVVSARDGAEALEAVRRERPALVMLDGELPAVSGYEVCRELKDEYGETLPVILISGARTEPQDCAVGLLIGADDYLTKPFDNGELLARARRCIERARKLGGGRVSNGSRDNGDLGLSPRELDVLAALMEGLTTKQIAQRLVISHKTVATHVQRILAKLGVHSRAEAIAFAYREELVEDVEAHAPVARPEH